VTTVPQRYLDVLGRYTIREHSEIGTVATALTEILELHRADVLAELRGQADVSVLDLVRQYGAARYQAGSPIGIRALDERRAADLYDRIAELLPRQPVQARTTSGDLIWQHIPCGWPHPWHPDSEPDTGPDGDPLGCHKPGLWRPLLVCSTPAPERCTTLSESGWRCPLPAGHEGLHTVNYDEPPVDLRLYEARNGHPYERPFQVAEPRTDLIAQVMAELGVTNPAEVLDALGALLRLAAESEQNAEKLKRSKELFLVAARRGDKAESERDEARAEVERQAEQIAKRLVDLERERDEAKRVAEDALAMVSAREAEEASGNNELWQLALDALAARPDPLVLSLPEVPEGTVAVTFPDNDDFPARAERLPGGLWRIEDTVYTLADLFVLAMNKELTVVSAPPREPRTWSRRPLVEDPPDDLRTVRAGGGTGEVYRRDPDNPDRWISGRGVAERWELLREVDLTEVLDDQG
jgi:hypothetical protein